MFVIFNDLKSLTRISYKLLKDIKMDLSSNRAYRQHQPFTKPKNETPYFFIIKFLKFLPDWVSVYQTQSGIQTYFSLTALPRFEVL